MAEQWNSRASQQGRPRVVLVADYPVDHASFTGGVQTATAGLLEGLREYQSEFDFHVVSLTSSLPADRHEVRDGYAFHFLNLPTVRGLPTRAPFRVFKIWSELRRIRPALVHCNTNSFAPLAVILGRHRRILTIHGVSQHEAHLHTGRALGTATADILIERYVHDRFPAVICISRYAMSVVGKRAITFAIPNAVGSAFLEIPQAAEHASRLRLVYIGALTPLKRPADVLASHTKLRQQFPEVETIICGHAEDAEYAHRLRLAAPEGVRFVDHATRRETADLLRSASVVVLASSQENAPMVIAEAMAVGAPVVATRVGGIPEMVADGATGLLFDPGDVPTLTAQARRLLEDPALRVRLGQAARQHALATFAPSSVARATMTAYRQVLEGKLVASGSRPEADVSRDEPPVRPDT